MSRPFSPRSSSSAGSYVRINGKIRAREVRVIGPDGQQIGVIPLHEAINMARSLGVDLVEVAPNATPPVCRVVDYGKYRYEQAKKDKESKKNQHANRVKEIQLTATIDPHDFSVKLGHGTDFLCDDMRVKISLRFRGREMAHQEFGREVMARFVKDLAPYGVPVEDPKLVGRGLNVMLTPLPRNKRAKSPRATENASLSRPQHDPQPEESSSPAPDPAGDDDKTALSNPNKNGGFAQTPFSNLDSQVRDLPAA